ncbi:MAG: ATP-binding protein [Coleofasciculus chthonoplastes F3-SA18-01]|uniref:ATP-binding protein n=1 Tax=Coleofasciculus chthonoplastes TaxID=64178 RepID=UPI003300D961
MLKFDELWELLTVQDESNMIEVKYGSEVGKSCRETISAFSNEPGLGGGYLILGIQDPTKSPSGQYEITGVSNPDKIQQDLTSLCNNNSFNQPLRPRITLETVEGKTIVIAYIPEVAPTEKPIFIQSIGFHKGTYRRIGSADVRCTMTDLQVFLQERQNQSYDTTPVADAFLDDLDPTAINAYRQLRAKANPNASELTLSDQDLLYSINAITRNPKNPQTYCPTFAGIILFGKMITLRRYFPMNRIDYMIVEGTEWVTNSDERYQSLTEIREPLLLAIPKLTILVINDLPKSFHLEDNQLQRQDIPLIPSRVIREAIVNAVMHRNYRVSSPIQIIRYANRLEIRNPGYSLKPTDEIDQPGSFTRNNTIASVLHELNIAETKGTGGKTMIEAMVEANLTLPKFDSQREKDRFCLTLYTHHLVGNEEREWLKQFRTFNLDNEDTRALIILWQIGKLDNFIYRAANNVETLNASRKLTRLRDLGVLETNGKGRATYYTLDPAFQSAEQLRADQLNQDSSTANQDSLSGQSPQPNQDSLSGQSPQPNQDSSKLPPEQLALELFPTVEKESLEDRLASIGKRTAPEEIKALILELCKHQDRSSSELASLVKRQRKYLLENYIKPLVDKGLLEYTIPDKPNTPDQTYRTSRDAKKHQHPF